MGRGDLTNHEWAMIGPLLLPECGRWARPAGDNRLFLNGMLHVLAQAFPSGTCMSATTNRTRFMSGFAVRPNRVCVDALLQTLVTLAWLMTGSLCSTAP